MKNKTIKIDHQLKYLKLDGDEKYQYHITPTKNRKERVIPMTDRVYKIMREFITSYVKVPILKKHVKSTYIKL